VTATVIKTVPETVTDVSSKISAKLPPPPPAPPMPPLEGVLLIEEVQVAELILPPDLPQTGSMVPMLGLFGLLLTGASLGLRLIRS
jgi:LPXTG-motif cell wall-anchored protein